MKVIDLLNKIANNEEVPEKIIFDNQIWKKENGSKNNIYYTNDSYYDLFVVIFKSNKTYSLNDEIEIIEEETIFEQNFTGYKLFQNGKEVASYILGTIMKPASEDDLKVIMEKKPKKIEELELDSEENIIYYEDGEKHRFNTNKQNKYFAHKIIELQKVVNYLLEKESDE